MVQWEKDPPAAEWDRMLAALAGHPLQSCLWGDARSAVNGIAQHRWVARSDSEPIWMIRVEERRLLGRKIAWAPRGPSGRITRLSASVPPEFEARLKAEGFSLLVYDPWVPVDSYGLTKGSISRGSPQTIWVDLSGGRQTVRKNLDQVWRYNVGLALRRGVTIDSTIEPSDVARFGILCKTVAEAKGFVLPGSELLMKELLKRQNSGIEARLMLARLDGVIRAGVFVIRCGSTLHYMWGGTDRSPPQVRAGEAAHWAVIEWGLSRGCARYDLEGIDPQGNFGTYVFKKKMGGVEVTLCGKRYFPMGAYAHIVSWLAGGLGQFSGPHMKLWF
jgi:hypothetical protein